MEIDTYTTQVEAGGTGGPLLFHQSKIQAGKEGLAQVEVGLAARGSCNSHGGRGGGGRIRPPGPEEVEV